MTMRYTYSNNIPWSQYASWYNQINDKKAEDMVDAINTAALMAGEGYTKYKSRMNELQNNKKAEADQKALYDKEQETKDKIKEYLISQGIIDEQGNVLKTLDDDTTKQIRALEYMQELAYHDK